jgi:hypothetical protein
MLTFWDSTDQLLLQVVQAQDPEAMQALLAEKQPTPLVVMDTSGGVIMYDEVVAEVLQDSLADLAVEDLVLDQTSVQQAMELLTPDQVLAQVILVLEEHWVVQAL